MDVTAGIGNVRLLKLSYIRAAFGTLDVAKSRLLKKRKHHLAELLNSNKRYSFPKAVAPRVSIIILAYNHAYHTLQCLLSVLSKADEFTEVMVFDNGSSDATAELLRHFDNVVVISAKKNLGFVGGMNAAAKHARGKYIAMLNNDARLMDGSLHQALDTFEAIPSCGYMGFRVVHANGGLQEAGCLIFQDGTTNCYLRYESETDPRALFVRDVDYCSGVFFVLRRDVFKRLGGFDEYFAPGYYEETDLCMRLRKAGLRCIYYPNFQVEHFEFGTGITSKTARALIKKNRAKFLERWKSTLIKEAYPQREIAAFTEQNALRLQPRPRHLLIVDKAEFDAKAILKLRDKAGTLTLYLLNANAQSIAQASAKLDLAVECVGGASLRALNKFLHNRKETFEKIETLGKGTDDLRAHLGL